MASKEADPAELIKSLGKRARVISVYGPFNVSALVEIPAELAAEVLGVPLASAATTNVVEAVHRDLDVIREQDEALADSTFAATAVRLAYELEHPYNSATSKSMCAKTLLEALNRLRELAPEPEEGDDIDELQARHAADLARSAAATD